MFWGQGYRAQRRHRGCLGLTLIGDIGDVLGSEIRGDIGEVWGRGS